MRELTDMREISEVGLREKLVVDVKEVGRNPMGYVQIQSGLIYP